MKINNEMLKQFEELRQNLINWYPFREEDTILEISVFDDSIAQNITKNVTFEKDIKNIPNSVMYDYILLVGILENSESMYKTGPEELIKILKVNLKEDGRLLIATDNKLGIYNLCSEQLEHNTKYLSKRTLENILDNQGLNNKKFYYPMPNYIIPNVLFTDKVLPNSETIYRNITFYDDNTLIVLNENKRFQKILDEDREEFCNFSNSFLIECSKAPLEDNNIDFIAFSNVRKKQFRIRTVIQGDKVYKYCANNDSATHIENIKNNINIMKQSNIGTVDSYEENRIVSEYQKNTNTFDKILLKEMKTGNIDKALQMIQQYEEEVIKKLKRNDSDNVATVFDKYDIKYTEKDIENLHFLKYGLWDLIFQNCFFIEDKFYFYDQEWMEENIPAEFILYRAIRYFDEIIRYISKEEVYKKVGIEKNQEILFEQLDNILQEKIRDEKMWNLHLVSEKQKNVEQKIEKVNEEKDKILNECKKLLNEKDARIVTLEQGIQEALKKIEEKEQTISSITNSTSWKITEPLRKIRLNKNTKK